MDLYESFRNPSSAYRQAPFWFWNHRLEPEELEWQIDQMHEKGIGGFVMHARHGLITPYLSDEWFERIRECCALARARGMVPWAYDERDWPSGPAAGTVIADHANRLQYIRLESLAVEGPAAVTFGEEVVAAYVSTGEESWRRLEGTSWEAPAGVWTVAKIVRFECPAILWFESYLDTLNPEACGAFIQSTYDKHVEKLGDLKAVGLEGFFTDEPALSTYPDDLGRIPWTPGLVDAFKARKGYDLLDCAPALFEQDGRGPQVRYDYWDVVTGLFEEAYFQAIAAWCDQHDVKLIGHALGEEPLFFQFRCLGSIFPYLKHFHMPGMDHLGCHVGKGNPCGMTPKMIESAALLAGRERTMTETFGESGWGLSLREMKWMADWQIANGINYFIPHAFYYSVAGRRKKDSPPSEFFQAPFWPHYRCFADYTARLTAAMTGGQHVAKIAVLYPMSSLWADFVPGQEPRAVLQEMETGFWQLGETLRSLHRDFVVIDEASFAKAEVSDKGFSVNGLEFEAIVLPQMTALHNDTMEMLIRVAAVCPAVALPMGYVRVLGADTASAGRVNVPSLGLRFTDGTDARALEKALAAITPDVAMADAADVQYLHRRKDNLDLYFFANTARAAVETTVSLESVGLAEIWDPATGERREAAGQRLVGGRLEVPVEFASGGSCLLVVDTARKPAESPRASRVELGPPTRLEIDDRWHFNPENGNVLTLRNWTMSTQARGHVIEMTYSTQFVTTEYLANMRVVLDGVPRNPYGVPEAVRPMMGPETLASVYWDGELLTNEMPWEFDPQFRVLTAPRRSAPGTHRIEIIIRNNGWFPQPGIEEYAWVLGDFHLDYSGDTPYLVPLRGINSGPWEEQGYPFFSGTGAYYTDVVIPENVCGRRIYLNAGRVGDLLEVELNGSEMGVCAWPPYRTEITSRVLPGRNLLVLKVSNSARNFFEGPDKTCPSGLLDKVVIEIV